MMIKTLDIIMHATGSAGHGLRAGMDADKKENTFECFKTNKSNK